MIDTFNRTISYLRMSLTDQCNLNCFYCRPGGCSNILPRESILTYDELYRLTTIAVGLGVKKVRLTGGEPLVRPGIVDFIPRLTSIPGLEDVSITTNGVLLRDNFEKIFAGGIRRLNISLDTLRRDRFKRITGNDCIDRVRESIELSGNLGFQPLKINMVVINGVNDDEVEEMASLSLDKPYFIRFIEYMPVGVNRRESLSKTVPISRIRKRIEKLGRLSPVQRQICDGPAQRFKFDGAVGEIGFIGSMSNHFCADCNRLRLTADGKLRPCLLKNIEVDVKGPMRRGASDHELAGIFLKAVRQKPFQHLLTSPDAISVQGHMHMIGG